MVNLEVPAYERDRRASSPVKVYRVARSLTQRELAERAGLGRSTVLRVERGEKVSFETVLRLSVVLGVPIEALLPPESE